jgi:putative ABC transport system substrate-binding protein
MGRREFIAGLMLSLATRGAWAQRAPDVPIVGLLWLGVEAEESAVVEALREGLRHNGLVEEVNLRLLVRFAEGKPDRLPELARELAAAGSRLIVTGGTTSVGAVKTALPDMPIVMAISADPVAMGFAQSLAHPGGKITGISILGSDLIGKQIDLLKELVPQAKAFAAMLQAANPGNEQFRRAFARASRTLNVEIHVREIKGPEDLAQSFDWASELRVDGVFLLQDPIFTAHRAMIGSLAEARRLPLVAGTEAFVRAGALAAYSLNNLALIRHSARYVSLILRGADPSELPIEQPRKIELIINLKTAKALGLNIPPSLLALADEVIE